MCQLTDGRGPGYARIVSGTVDIGADEFQNQPAPIVSGFVVLWGSNDGSDLESERGGGLLPQGRTNVLPGDVNGDGVVNSKDLAAIHKWANVYLGPPSVVYRDITGDGKANGRDYLAVKDRLGTMLAPPLPKAKRLDAVLDRAHSHSTTHRS